MAPKKGASGEKCKWKDKEAIKVAHVVKKANEPNQWKHRLGNNFPVIR